MYYINDNDNVKLNETEKQKDERAKGNALLQHPRILHSVFFRDIYWRNQLNASLCNRVAYINHSSLYTSFKYSLLCFTKLEICIKIPLLVCLCSCPCVCMCVCVLAVQNSIAYFCAPCPSLNALTQRTRLLHLLRHRPIILSLPATQPAGISKYTKPRPCLLAPHCLCAFAFALRVAQCTLPNGSDVAGGSVKSKSSIANAWERHLLASSRLVVRVRVRARGWQAKRIPRAKKKAILKCKINLLW